MKIIKAAKHFEFYELPKPAKLYIPDWYKKIPSYFNGTKFQWRNFSDNKTLKHCLPFIDAFQTGYIVELQQDINVEVDIITGEPQIFWGADPHPIVYREKKYESVPAPAGHSPEEFTWVFRYSLKLPKGYSMLMAHPLNRFDLPFTTLSGIHDTDGGLHQGKVPFFIKSDFEGVIPAGTPIIQLIPIKRQSWIMKESKKLKQIGRESEWRNLSSVKGDYKKKRWVRKDYA